MEIISILMLLLFIGIPLFFIIDYFRTGSLIVRRFRFGAKTRFYERITFSESPIFFMFSITIYVSTIVMIVSIMLGLHTYFGIEIDPS